ncbi:MAG: MFS transporter [Acidobacteria bacterium]|nr:MFS transporter [Acidobacteriota bacterium]
MRTGAKRVLPRGVIALGFVSMFMDTSSEMIHSLLPVFLVTGLGVNTLVVGLIEGLAESTAAITKIFAGVVSDWIGRRKPLVLLGYGIAALTKPLFPLATGAGTVFIARLVDRIGKGIRGAPRDALVADLTPEPARGAAYGLRQSMDTVGAFAGPALALAFMALSGNNFRFVFWIAVLPAFISVAFVVFGVEEPETHAAHRNRGFPLQRREIGRLSPKFWLIVAFGATLTLARFSEAFLLLRAENVGLAIGYVPIVLIVMNVFYAASAYPFGQLSDRGNRSSLLAIGIGFLIAADLVLAAAGATWSVLIGSMLWGLHMGATQGLLSAVVAAAAPVDRRGTAFGVFNLVTGGTLLLASVLAGFLWTAYGPAVTFLAGAGFSTVALIGLLTRRPGVNS